MNNSAFPFPDEFARPKNKVKDEYGLQAAQAMYFSNNRYGYRTFNDLRQFNSLVELAQGRQSTDNIYRMMGFHNDKGTTNDNNGALAYIDIQVLNLITKYVNRAVAKLQRFNYNISFSAVDPLSVDEAKQHSASIKTFYQLRDWFTAMKVDPQQYFPGLEINLLPEYPDELMFNLSVNTKIKKIVDAEKTMKLVNGTMNDMRQIQRECDWDAVVLGRQHMHCYLDENGYPRARRINPKFWGGSYVENEDFSKQEYAFFIDFISKNQFKKESEGKLTQAQIEEVLGKFAFPNTAASFGNLPNWYNNYDGLEYIPVMKFYFLSNDNLAYKIWNHKETGNRMMDSTHYDYFPKESKKDQKVVQNSFTSVYGGSWVVDSNIVYDYGRKEYPRTNLVDTRLPIITFAPNMKEGRIVSMVSQMIEPTTMINVAWNRMKDILAKGRMGVIELNLSAIDNIALGKGGKQWTEQEAIDFFMQSNIWATRQNTNQYGQSLGKSIQESKAGLEIADYLTTITTCIKFMDELSGSTVVESANMPDRLTTGTMKANVAAGAEAIEYLVNGHVKMFQQASHVLLLLTQQAKKNKVKIQGMIPALGTSTTEFFEVPDDLGYCEYGLQAEPEPSDEEWAYFFMEVQESIKLGKLNSSDSAFIRQIKNLTMARYVMANRERVNELKASKMREQEQQFQLKVGQDATQSKLQMEMQLMDKKKQDEMEIMAVQARIDDAMLTKKVMLEGEVNRVSDMVKAQIAKQQGIDSILKEAMRSRSEEDKSQKGFDAKVIAAHKQADTQLKTALINKENKKKKEKVA